MMDQSAKQAQPWAADAPRAALERLIREQGEDYASLSRLIGRNAAYIQQYLQRGTPRRLPERERAILADYFGVDERLLGAPERAAAPDPAALAIIPRLDIGASAGPGALAGEERAIAGFGFDPRWLRQLAVNPATLSIIRVEGDSMAPTLSHGDDIMVDSGDGVTRLRDGIYVLRREDVLLVKRIARGTAAGRVAIVSDNPAYPSERDVAVATLDIVGRVVWAGRRIG